MVKPSEPAQRPYFRISKRRRAREEAVKALYELDLNPAPVAEIVNRPRTGEQKISGTVRAFAVQLTQGVVDHRDEIDEAVVKYASRQRLDRMAVIDRNILRLAAYEMMFMPDIPVDVTMNEAIDLAALFGDSETASFVNGLLSKMVQDMDLKSRKPDRPRPASQKS